MSEYRSLLIAAGLLALAGCGEPAGSRGSSRTPPAAASPEPDAAAGAMTMRRDLASRSTDMRWPDGLAPEQADLFAHNETRIDASCGRVWRHLVRSPEWPRWYPNARDVGLASGAAELTAGAVFRWSTFGLPLESRVAEFEPNRRLAWYGYPVGQPSAFYHAFQPRPDGNRRVAVTDEVGKGPEVVEFRRADEGRMRRGHQLWLDTLTWRSEERR